MVSPKGGDQELCQSWTDKIIMPQQRGNRVYPKLNKTKDLYNNTFPRGPLNICFGEMA